MKINRRRRKSLSRPRKHKSWQVQEAKAKFSQLISETVSSGYQTITKNGEPVAYMVSKEEFEHYLKPQKSLIEVFDKCPYPEVDIDIERSQESIREIDL
jgi:antitoxin Phd